MTVQTTVLVETLVAPGAEALGEINIFGGRLREEYEVILELLRASLARASGTEYLGVLVEGPYKSDHCKSDN